MQQENKNTESIPYLEKYLELNESEIYLRLLYARALLFRTDLETPVPGEGIYERTEKLKKIKGNYRKSSEIFSKYVLILQNIRPREPSLGKWFFLWAMAEWFSGQKEKSISLFKKAIKLDFTLSSSYYNIASIYESLGQSQDAKIYWGRYLKAEKEFLEER
ncbi:MAG: tetratricopeptide repeat protein [Leptospiraceae bacterium]|nr:tetratricopeptide repeat protein [Leptospiraceae bacterium]MCK6382432.1 tetratricopeptide repeat protein [Leptospiraceae bacterium]NUM40845.1 tetratricopeptide repeat protein [Leptospiraceae bacterium]